MEEKKKLKGFAAWTPERRKAAQAKARATRAAKKATPVAADSASADELRKAVQNPETIDKVLGDGFKYTLDEKEQAIWEHDETISPLHVPKEISDRYPDMAWKWVSTRALENRGAGYKGWEVFSDKSNPRGVKRGNDLRLAARPQSMSDSYRKWVEDKSSQAVRDVQEGAVGKMDRAIAELRARGLDAEILAPGCDTDSPGTPGISIGGKRGMDAGEIQRNLARVAENRAKNKKYFVMGR